MTAGVEHLRIGRMRCEAHEVILGLRNPLRDAIGADREEAVVGGEVETIGIARIYGDPVEVGLAGQVRDRGLRNRDRAADEDGRTAPRSDAPPDVAEELKTG